MPAVATKRKSPTSRTLERLRKLDVAAQVVERWNPHARKRVDLFGCIDLVAITNDWTYGIQATSGDNHAARRKKSEAEPKFWVWVLCDSRRFVVWSWRKNADGLWTGRIELAEVSYENGPPEVVWREISEAEL